MNCLRGALDFLIIDEATQSTEISTLIPINLEPKKLVLIGDPQQLPATVYHKMAQETLFQRSLYERLLERGEE